MTSDAATAYCRAHQLTGLPGYLVSIERQQCESSYAPKPCRRDGDNNKINKLTCHTSWHRSVLGVAATFLGGGSMSQALATVNTAAPVISRERALKILSKSLYRICVRTATSQSKSLLVASELISLVTSDIKEDAQLV